MSSVGKSSRRDRKGKSDSVAGRGGNKGVLKRWGRFHYSTIAFFTMENYGKDSQEVKREGNKIYDDDTVWKPRGRFVDTQPTVGDGGLGVENESKETCPVDFSHTYNLLILPLLSPHIFILIGRVSRKPVMGKRYETGLGTD